MLFARDRKARVVARLAIAQLLGCAGPLPGSHDALASEETSASRRPLLFQSQAPVFGQPRLAGKGCTAGTWGIAFHRGEQVEEELVQGSGFMISFRAFEAHLGPDFEPDDATTHCNIGIPITSTEGFQHAVTTFTYRGFANLQPGTTLNHFAEYWFAGTPSTPLDGKASGTVPGPWRKNFIFDDDLAARSPDQLNWSACTKQAVILIDVLEQLTASTPQTLSSTVVVESLEGKATLEVGLTSRPCTP